MIRVILFVFSFCPLFANAGTDIEYRLNVKVSDTEVFGDRFSLLGEFAKTVAPQYQCLGGDFSYQWQQTDLNTGDRVAVITWKTHCKGFVKARFSVQGKFRYHDMTKYILMFDMNDGLGEEQKALCVERESRTKACEPF